MDNENIETPEVDVEETSTEEETINYQAEAEKWKQQAEKYKWYFKKEKAKQKQSKTDDTSDVDVNDLKQEIMEEIKFFTKHPEAETVKEWMQEYLEKWLSYDDAYKLAASKNDPSLLIDSQTQAKAESGQKDLTGIAAEDWGDVDFSSIQPNEVLNLSETDQDKYWEFKKNGG